MQMTPTRGCWLCGGGGGCGCCYWWWWMVHRWWTWRFHRGVCACVILNDGTQWQSKTWVECIPILYIYIYIIPHYNVVESKSLRCCWSSVLDTPRTLVTDDIQKDVASYETYTLPIYCEIWDIPDTTGARAFHRDDSPLSKSKRQWRCKSVCVSWTETRHQNEPQHTHIYIPVYTYIHWYIDTIDQ